MPFSIGSERQLPEQMDLNLLFGWLVGQGTDDPYVAQGHGCESRAPQGPAAFVGRACFGRRRSDHGLGIHVAVPAKERRSAAALYGNSGEPPSQPVEETSRNTKQPQKAENWLTIDTLRQTRNAKASCRGQTRLNAPRESRAGPHARLYEKAPGAAAMGQYPDLELPWLAGCAEKQDATRTVNNKLWG